MVEGFQLINLEAFCATLFRVDALVVGLVQDVSWFAETSFHALWNTSSLLSSEIDQKLRESLKQQI
jgi:hypothetical protein